MTQINFSSGCAQHWCGGFWAPSEPGAPPSQQENQQVKYRYSCTVINWSCIGFLYTVTTRIQPTIQSRRKIYTNRDAHCIIRQNKHIGKSQPQDYTVKKVNDFSLPCGDVTNQTLPGRKKLNYSRPGRVWLQTSRLETGKPLTFFTV